VKVVINRCFGGFGLSKACVLRSRELGYDPAPYMDQLMEDSFFKRHNSWGSYDTDRANPRLIQAIEELGVKANGEHAELMVVEIPDGTQWEIQEYDGMERLTAPIHYLD